MSALLWLIPIAIVLGLIGLFGFFWTVKNDQYDDPEGDASRILHSEDKPL